MYERRRLGLHKSRLGAADKPLSDMSRGHRSPICFRAGRERRVVAAVVAARTLLLREIGGGRSFFGLFLAV